MLNRKKIKINNADNSKFILLFFLSLMFLFQKPACAETDLLSQSGVKGGLIVQVGCVPPADLQGLSPSDSFLVHGLDRSKENILSARTYLMNKNSYGRITVKHWNEKTLPYVDNLVNLLIIKTPGIKIKKEEILRVLAPGGILFLIKDDNRGLIIGLKSSQSVLNNKYIKYTKPFPKEIDSWTHYLFDSGNNAVSKDQKVGPVKGMQWVAGPPYARSHEHFGGMSAMVSDKGRIFYIEDVGPISSVFLPPDWQLVARDAFSGVKLWQRSIKNWESSLRGFRSGPPEIGWRLVVNKDRVFAALNYGEPVTVLDAATGKDIYVMKETKGAREFRYNNNTLYVLADDMTATDHDKRKKWINDLAPGLEKYQFPTEEIPMYGKQRIIAVNIKTRKKIWEKKFKDPGEVMPTTLAVNDKYACFQTVSRVVCLDCRTGKKKWDSPRPVASSRFSWTSPTLVISGDIIISGDRMPDYNNGSKPAAGSSWIMDNKHTMKKIPGQVIAFSLKDGSKLWQAPAFENYTIPMDVFVINNMVWTGDIRTKKFPGFTKAYDLFTGKIASELPDNGSLYELIMGHNRCYRNKATTRYLLLGRDGIEFIDLKSGTGHTCWWTRGTCQYGIMPANGFIYAPKHSCACHPEEKLNGFNVLSSRSSGEVTEKNPVQTEKGPAYGKRSPGKSKQKSSADWPFYRKDNRRSSYHPVPSPKKLKTAWIEKFHSPVTPPVSADGIVFIAETEQHRVHALSIQNGKRVWSFTSDGRIDSPPSLYNDLCLFGTRSGTVYCLEKESGELVWKFKAGLNNRLLFSYERLESVWPVHGTVLIDDQWSGGKPLVYFSAGRSSHLDHGIQLYALDLYTAKIVHHQAISTGGGADEKNSLPDVLSLQNNKLFMRHLSFDENLTQTETEQHLYAPGGFLDKTWWHRTYWLYGTQMANAYGGWPRSGNQSPAGRLLVYDDKELIFGYGRMEYKAGKGHVIQDAVNEYKLFAEIKKPKKNNQDQPKEKKKKSKKGKGAKYTRVIQWKKSLPFLVRAIVLTKDGLLTGGGNSLTENAKDHGPGHFAVVSRKDGSLLYKLKLQAPPVLDGMAMINSGIFISGIDGSLTCLK